LARATTPITGFLVDGVQESVQCASFAKILEWKMEQTSLKNLLDDLERRVRALRGYL